jgi:glycopeptide antibiotics resistance protein
MSKYINTSVALKIYITFVLLALSISSLFSRMTQSPEYIPILFNLIPFSNIAKYVTNSSHYNVGTLIYNMAAPIFVALPIGILSNKQSPLAQRVVCFIALTLLFLIVRTLVFKGYFDIDKVIIYTIGFYIGDVCSNMFSRKLRYDDKSMLKLSKDA